MSEQSPTQGSVSWVFTPSYGGYIYSLPEDHLRTKIIQQLIAQRTWIHKWRSIQCAITGHVSDKELVFGKGYLKNRGFFVTQLCPRCCCPVVAIQLKNYEVPYATK